MCGNVEYSVKNQNLVPIKVYQRDKTKLKNAKAERWNVERSS